MGQVKPIGSFEGLRRVNEVTYELALSPSLSIVQPVFHVLMLKKYILDDTLKLQYEELDVSSDLSTRKRHCQSSIEL